MIGMKLTIYKTICLSLLISTASQSGYSAALQKMTKPTQAPMLMEKSLSPIEKALSQQKRDRIENKVIVDNDQIKVMTALKIAPTQNFFAEQHQRFSRFVQAIFPQHNS